MTNSSNSVVTTEIEHLLRQFSGKISENVNSEKSEFTQIVGQPGSGKTRLSHSVLSQLENKGRAYTFIDENALAATHHAYCSIEKRDGTPLAMLAARHHVQTSMKLLMENAIKKKHDIVFESFKPENIPGDIARRLQNKNYATHLIVVATPEHMSRQATQSREMNERRENGHARSVHIHDHDKLYAEWPTAISKAAASNSFNRICVITPNFGTNYIEKTLVSINRNQVNEKFDQPFTVVLQSLIQGRTLDSSPTHKDHHRARWDVLSARIGQSKADSYYKIAIQDDKMLRLSPKDRYLRESKLILNAIDNNNSTVLIRDLMRKTLERQSPYGKINLADIKIPQHLPRDHSSAAQQRLPPFQSDKNHGNYLKVQKDIYLGR